MCEALNILKSRCSRSFQIKRHVYAVPLTYYHSNAPKRIEQTGYPTGITVYNSATKCKVPFILRNMNYASWYMCGPTVYDSAHVGHACCYVKFDIIRRILESFFDINVVLVMGITDIDDKIIKRAITLNEDVRILSNRYEKEFFKDMCNLNVLAPNVIVRVTDVIPSIIDFVQNIVKKDMAYTVEDGSVYFDTKKYKQYGKLCAIPNEFTDLHCKKDIKKSLNDFALWKAAKPDEPFWLSPWGKGRPGWHIECSTIASNVLGSTVDLHSGGIDLLFPHHENEEAQSCVYHDVKQWVNYWLHTGHLHLKGDEKMSKSLKNTISIQEFLASNAADHFRMYCLLSRYRSDVEYSDAAFSHAKAICRKLQSFLSNCDTYIRGIQSYHQIQEAVLLEKLTFTKQNFIAALADDFDTAKALGILMEFVSDTNVLLHATPEEEVGTCRNRGVIAAASSFVQQVTGKLGLTFLDQETLLHQKDDSSKIMDIVVDFRSEVRELALCSLKENRTVLCKEKDLQLIRACDKLRDRLNVVGIEVKDHGQKSSWNVKQKS